MFLRPTAVFYDPAARCNVPPVPTPHGGPSVVCTGSPVHAACTESTLALLRQSHRGECTVGRAAVEATAGMSIVDTEQRSKGLESDHKQLPGDTLIAGGGV